MDIRLSDHFTYKRLLRFTLPSVMMMIFTSVYCIVDGLFISNFVGKTAFAAVNLIFPFLQIIGGFGAMLGVGGSALVAKTLGEGEKERADRYFTMMILLMAIIGIFFTVVGILLVKPVAILFGATEGMLRDCILYGRIYLIFNTTLMMQYTFQSFLVVAEKPSFGLFVTVLAGLTNMAFDALFVAVFKWGVPGAAVATGLSQVVGGVIPLVWFFSRRNTSSLRFVKTRIEWRPVLKACGNGLSEMFSNISASVISVFYNLRLIEYAGENGVAAYGVVMYAAFFFVSVLVGYASGSSPIVGYHYGAWNHAEMRNILKKSIAILSVTGFCLTAVAFGFARPISAVFIGYDEELLALTEHAFRIGSLAFLLMGLDIYTSSFFTALNDGLTSMEVSFLRTLVFPLCAITFLPMLFGIEGVWFSFLGSEVPSFIVCVLMLLAKQKKYHY